MLFAGWLWFSLVGWFYCLVSWLDWFRYLGLRVFAGFIMNSGTGWFGFCRRGGVGCVVHTMGLCVWSFRVVWYAVGVDCLVGDCGCLLGFLCMACFGANSSCLWLWVSECFAWVCLIVWWFGVGFRGLQNDLVRCCG